MQVATLFRESANLLGASSMDSSQSHQQMQQQQQMESQQSIGSHFNHHMHHYKMSYSSPALNGILNNAAINRAGIMVKQEALDDGYETSPDLEIRSTDSNQHYHTPLTPHTPQTPHTPRTPLTPISATSHQPQQPCSSATTLSQVSVKCETQADPYSFVDDEITMSGVRATSSPNDNFNVIACDAQISLGTSLRTPPNHICTSQQQQQQQQMNLKMINNAVSTIHGVHQPKKRGRKKKCEMILTPEEAELAEAKKRAKTYKERKKHDRFDGMPEEEVSKRQLPDHLTNNLDIIIIGINPGLFAAYKGHHYAGPGNHFWKCLHLSGLTPEPLTADDDYKLLRLGIGFTNMVARATKGSADLTRKEIKEGSHILLEKLKKYKPKIAVFNGKLIYEVFSGKKEFGFGRQPNLIDGTNTYMWVMPSSSARCAQLPRAADKVPYYAALKKFRDYLNGSILHLDESDIVFADSKLKKREQDAMEDKKNIYAEEYDEGLRYSDGIIIKQESSMITGKKKRGRPKKIKDVEEIVPLDSEKFDLNGEIIKKRRGRPKKIHQQQKQTVHETKQHELPKQHEHHHLQQMSHMNNGYENRTICFSPSIMSHSKSFSHMTPYPQATNDTTYYGQSMNGSPFIIVNENKQISSRMQHFSHSCKSLSMTFIDSNISSEINTKISSGNNPRKHSPLTSTRAIETSDFDEITARISQQQQIAYHPADHRSPTTTPSHTNYGGYVGYHDQEQQQNPHRNAPTPMSQSTDEHSQNSHLTPPHSQHTPTHAMSPHLHEQYGVKRASNQDVASKSLSDLESLVDQIPSITENNCQRLQHHGHSSINDDSPTDKIDVQESYVSTYGNGSAATTPNYSPPQPSSQLATYNDHYSNSYNIGTSRLQDSSQLSKSYTVENLTSSNYTPSSLNHHNTYSNIIQGSHYPVSMSTSGASNSYLFSGLESSLIQHSYNSITSHHHPSLHNHHSMTNSYSYNSSYSSSFDVYSAPLSNASIHSPQSNYQVHNGSTSGTRNATSLSPPYLQQSDSRPPVDLTYDGV